MKRLLSRGLALTLLLWLCGLYAVPAQACIAYSGFDPQKPFTDHYLEGSWAIFRGRPIDFRLLFAEQGHSPWAAEISFAVIETYHGQLDESVAVLWFLDPIFRSRDLNAFKEHLGEDLVVVLGKPFSLSLRFSSLPPIAVNSCMESAMRSYAVMEPVLREKGLIE